MPRRRLSRDGQEEARLAKSCVKGNTEAFAALVDRYQDAVYNIIYRMVGDREEARDLAQEAFMRAFEGMYSFDSRMPFRAWMFRIATNAAIDHLRRKRMNEVSIDAAFGPDRDGDEPVRSSLEPAGPESDIPENVSVSNEVTDIVRRAISELPDNYRAVTVLHHMEGMSYGEIALVMGVPRNTAKTWARRARGILCESLEGAF